MADETAAGRGVITWLGRADYRATWALQRGLAEARRQALAPDAVLLVEHPPTITLGRRGTPGHVLLSGAEQRRRGIAVVPIDRGGDVTYHGPGQLVIYPILHLGRWGSDIVRYVRRLEEVGIRAAAEFGVRAERQAGLTGVWVGDAKLAAIGVRVSRWVTTHGMAINVDPDLADFAAIIPCGLRDRGVTSFQAELGTAPALPAVMEAVARQFAAVFNLELAWADAAAVRSRALPAPPEPTASALQLGLSVA